MDHASSDTLGMNDSGTCEKIDTRLTQGRSRTVHEWTYFIRSVESIKIGRSVSPLDRMKSLQNGNGGKLELLVAVSGARLSEADAHQKFQHLRIHGEWFRPEQDLLDFIEVLKVEITARHRARRGNPTIGSLHDLRKAHGFDTPIGHCCSNLAEQVKNMETYVRPAWAQGKRQTLPWSIDQQMKRLEVLVAASKN